MTLVTLSSVIKRPLTEHVFRLVRSGTLLSRLARVRNFSNSVIAFCFTLFEADSENFLVHICTRRSAHDHFLTLIKRSFGSYYVDYDTIKQLYKTDLSRALLQTFGYFIKANSRAQDRGFFDQGGSPASSTESQADVFYPQSRRGLQIHRGAGVHPEIILGTHLLG